MRVFGLSAFAACIFFATVLEWATSESSTSKPSETSEERLYGKYKNAVVVANTPQCAAISRKILQKGGKAVDAVIAAIFCEGVTSPQLVGIGGGISMIIYDGKFKNCSCINATGTASAASTADISNSDTEIPRRVVMPGTVKGCFEAYKKFGGGLPWEELIADTISLCVEGIPINKKLADILAEYDKIGRRYEEFRRLFIDPITGAPFKAGQNYTNPQLAKTLKIMAEKGGDALYEGPIAAMLASDIRENYNVITEVDLKMYKDVVEKPFIAPLNINYTIYTVHPPSSGPILAYILRILNELIPAPNEILNTQRITEAFKFGFGLRSKLGDPEFVKINQTLQNILSDEFVQRTRDRVSDTSTSNDTKYYGDDFGSVNDHNAASLATNGGVANLAVIHENGDAVVATSTINLRFGSQILSQSTGIIVYVMDKMNSFSSPNTTNYFGSSQLPANSTELGERPQSYSYPSIITDSKGDVKMLINAGGETKSITSVAIVLSQVLLMGENISICDAMNNVSFHHQLTPMVWWYDPKTMPKDIVEQMRKIGHCVNATAPNSSAAMAVIHRENDAIVGNCNEGCHIDGF